MILKKKIKNKLNRHNFYISEIYLTVLKFLFLKLNEKFLFFKKNYLITRNIVYNLCLFSSKSCSLFRSHKVSRIPFRNISSFGFFFGIKKASW